MIFSLLAAALIATAPGTLRPAVAATPAAKINAVTKLNGVIASIGTNNFVVSGTTINLTPTTIVLRKFGGKSGLSELSVGDQVQVLGKWTSTTKSAVDAKVVRNSSIQKRRGTFVGTVTAVTDTGFTFQPLARPLQTVTVSATTRYVDRKMKPITKTAVLAGHKIQVKGLWDNRLNTVTEVAGVKDYSLPASPSAALR